MVVAHSGAHDPTVRLSKVAGVRVEHSVRRLFAGAARNLGARDADETWLAFVDSDVIVPADWLCHVLGRISREPGPAIVFSGVDHASDAGYWAKCLWWLEFGSIHPYLPERANDGGASAAMIVSRQTFQDLSGFDETLFNAQDSDLFLRLEKAGGRVIFLPRPEVLHRFKQGMRHCLRRAGQLGTHSARVRKLHDVARGSIVMRFPVLSPLLAPARLLLIYRRALASPAAPKASLLLHTPGIFLALAAWNWRFCQEMFSADATD